MTIHEDYLAIDTPENVVFGYEIVGIGSRFMAALIDSAIIGLIYGIVLLTIVFFVGNFAGQETLFGSFVIGVAGLIGFFFIWGYYIFFEIYWNGRSPGKQLVGLRVVRRDGTPLTLAESAIRNLIRLIDFLPFAYGVGVVTMFIDSHSRRLGDLAASTLVVRDKEDVTLTSLATTSSTTNLDYKFSPINKFDEVVTPWPISRLTSDDRHLIEEFLQRRNELQNGPALSAQIYRTIRHRLGLEAQPDLSYTDTILLFEAILIRTGSQ